MAGSAGARGCLESGMQTGYDRDFSSCRRHLARTKARFSPAAMGGPSVLGGPSFLGGTDVGGCDAVELPMERSRLIWAAPERRKGSGRHGCRAKPLTRQLRACDAVSCPWSGQGQSGRLPHCAGGPGGTDVGRSPQAPHPQSRAYDAANLPMERSRPIRTAPALRHAPGRH